MSAEANPKTHDVTLNPDDDIVEATLNVQMDCLARAKSALTNFGKDSNDRKKRTTYHQLRLDSFAKIVTEFERNHRSLLQMIPRSQQVDYDYFKDDVVGEFEEIQVEFVSSVQEDHEERFPSVAVPPTMHNEMNLSSVASLPPVKIPPFSGAYADWKSFYDLFKSIVHKNERLPGSHKFQYLLGALNGEARDLISGYTVCDDDYPKAWKTLVDTYNDHPSMFMLVMNKFSAIEPIMQENPDRLRELIKSTSACFKSLESIGLVQGNIDAVITYYAISKLPSETLAHWEQTRDRKNLPTFEALRTCVETRIRVTTAVANFKTEKSAKVNNINQLKPNQQHQQPQQLKKGNFRAHHSTKQQASAPAPSTSSNQSQKKFACPICSIEGHPLRSCEQFQAMSAAERKTTIVRLRYCVNCLAYNHQESKCRSSHTCMTCGERHHTLLHTTTASVIASHAATASAGIETGNSIPTSLSSNVLLATAIVTVLDANNEPHALRALIDQGSEANFITESATLSLQLSKSSMQATITGIGESIGKSKSITTLTLQSRYSNEFTITINALVMNKVTNLLPSTSIKHQRWQHIIDLTLADPSYHRTGRIDLVLGAEVFAQIIMDGVRIGLAGTPVAQQTKFGWILSGNVSNEPIHHNVVRAHHATSTLETLMENFLSVESIEDANPMTAEEHWCENWFVDTHERHPDGRFQVRLPFRFEFDSSASLGRSRSIAIKCLLQLERRFASNPALKREYAKAINEYLETDRMQPTTSTEIERDGTICAAYLPHHAVFKESSTSTKLRVVFDGSRKTTNGKSLNEVLVAGPKIQSDIVSIIINWRFHRIAFTADVQKMYLQVKVDPRDINFQRIVWRNDPSEPIGDYCLNRLTFGTSCAPFIAIRAVNQLATDEQSNYPEASTIILNDAYVDDVISGGDDVPTVQKLVHDLCAMMKSGGFDLKKWASNVSEVMQQIPEADREIKLPVELNANDPIKALGIAWNTGTDSFSFKSTLDDNNKDEKVTKRIAASVIAKVFDPIGLIAPVIVVGKIIMKKLWGAELDWDDALTPPMLSEWKRYIDGLQHLSKIKIPRWINTSKLNSSFQLHGFSDASSMAYGAALYLRTVDPNGSVYVHLIASKSKVAPKKALTIPRLELCGAHLLAKLLASTRQGLRHISVAAEDITLWCDSEIVCHWLRNDKPKKVFVENRVAKIQETTMGMRWRHVRTYDNPADLVSRGTSPEELAESSLWWHGPSWLRSPKETWPISNIDASKPPDGIDLELRHIVQANVCITEDDIIDHFSNYNHLIRVSAFCRRFINNCRKNSIRKYGQLTVEELQHVRRHWILQAQKQNYFDEMQCLSKIPPDPVHDKSKLLPLFPFIDGNGILRVSGRLEHSTLSYDEKHPIILPPNHHFTNLVIERLHRRLHHGGPLQIAARLRREYWLLNPMRTINSRLHKCIICFRHNAKTSQQLMGSLPPPRVSQTIRAFLHTAIDYCGPIALRTSKYRGIRTHKGYIAVFVCLTTRAIHIECVDGLTTDAFLAAFKRFVSRRGLPSDCYSDNGTNFHGAVNEMDKEMRQIINESQSSIADQFTDENIRWHFTPPGSPHFNGMCEAGVKSVKRHLYRIIGESTLSYEELHTLLTQIEACLNSRPISAINNDPSDFSPLTPAHFLVNTDLVSVPEPSYLEINSNRLNRWHQIQQMKQHFWKRWRADYLSLLQQRPKWNRESTNLRVNEMVLVRDDRFPSHKWPLARIIATHPGTDGHVRVVTVKTPSGTYRRNITKICRLPIENDDPCASNDVTSLDVPATQ